jgi:hypothetical protein
MTDYVTPRQKTQRAFRAYMDLLDTADWIKGELRGPLMSFDLAMGEFRLLELLYREGALFISDIARKRRLQRQGVDETRMGGAEGCGAAARGVRTSAPGKVQTRGAEGGPASQRGRPDEIGEEVHRKRAAEPFESSKGDDARARRARAGDDEPALPEAARGRCVEVCFRDHARGWRGLS